jgi:hypothetical protein
VRLSQRTGRGAACVGLTVLSSLGLLVSGAPLQEAPASDSEPLLPQLVADPPDGMTLVASAEEGRTRLLLRFNGYLHNIGPGALDFRGTREKPQVAGKSEAQLAEEIASYKDREETLPQSLEEELAQPQMSVSQRLFTTNAGAPSQPETYLERPHVEQPSGAEMAYSSADGHHHWHLQRVARYSLWNAERTGEVAAAQKVGFCLTDSQHVEPDVGPSTPVYHALWPYTGFCRHFEPASTSVYEGISPGWRDVYDRELAFQWVDASDVLPGEYWLREDIDPTGVIEQAGGPAAPGYADSPTVIPGFDAKPLTKTTDEGEDVAVVLGARRFGDEATPRFTVVAGPQHGALSKVKGDRLTYTPDAGFTGNDSFTYSASDPTSPFPESPAIASVSLVIGSTRPQPSLSISGAQAEMTAGTSSALLANVTNDSGGVEWEASAGTLTPEGEGDRRSLLTAPNSPPVGGALIVTARLEDDHAVSAQQLITIRPVQTTEPAPEPPSSSDAVSSPRSAPAQGPTSGSGETSSGRSGSADEFTPSIPRASLSRPRAMLFGRELVIATIPSAPGRIRVAAYGSGHELGACSSETPAWRSFTCRIRLRRTIAVHAHIGVRASLYAGGRLVWALLAPQRIPEMKMPGLAPIAHDAGARSRFWCSPSMLAEDSPDFSG